jgi:uncharacterized membrane-anchored protein YhcB (DUF1043 family)
MNSENKEIGFEASISALKKLYGSGSEFSLIDDLEQSYRRLQEFSSDEDILKSNSFEDLIVTAIERQLKHRVSDFVTKSDLVIHATEVESEIDKSKLSLEEQVDLLNQENVGLRKKQDEHFEVINILHSTIRTEKIKALDQNAELKEELDVAKAKIDKKTDELEAHFSKHQDDYDSNKEKTNQLEVDRIGREQDLIRSINDSWFFPTFRRRTLNSKGSKDEAQEVTDVSNSSASGSDVDDTKAEELSTIPTDQNEPTVRVEVDDDE